MKNLLCLLILIGYSVVGFGQQDSVFTIEGTVWDRDLEKPAINAMVDIVDINDSEFGFVWLTDSTGIFKFEVPKNRCYSLSVSKENYFGESTDTCFYEKGNQPILLELSIYYYSLVDYYIPYPDSLKSDLKIIIQDENGKILKDFHYWIYPINYDKYQPKAYLKFGNEPFNITIFQKIDYQIYINKVGYQTHSQVLTIDGKNPITEYVIKLKKTN